MHWPAELIAIPLGSAAIRDARAALRGDVVADRER
jgi:hypothetical protein